MKIGYARVSTISQSLDNQVDKLIENGCECIYSDKFTGKTRDRPEFKKMMNDLKIGDVLVVTKLDRLARSAQDALNIIEELNNRGIAINLLNLGIMDNSSSGKLLFTVLAAFAEFERDLIVERTQAGKERAKLNENFRDGRPPKYSKKQLDLAIELMENNTMKEVSLLTGISLSTLYRYKAKLKNNWSECIDEY